MAPLQKLPKNVQDLGKVIVTKGFKKIPKVQQIAQSGHTDPPAPEAAKLFRRLGEQERYKNEKIT